MARTALSHPKITTKTHSRPAPGPCGPPPRGHGRAAARREAQPA